MNGKTIEGDVLSKVAPRALRAYVEAHGWRQVEPYGDIGDVYALGNETPEILVPMSSRFADYTLRLGQMITILADTEEREREAVLRDLSLSDVDLVRVRLLESRNDGSIPLDAAAAMIPQSRDMLLAAACSAARPQRAFRAGRIKEANDYVTTVRLGQTERGSFVINLLSPVPPALQPELTPNPSDEPFPRKVMHKLVSGLQATREAVDLANRDSDIRLFEERVPDGVSANLCAAVGEMLGKVSNGGIDVSVSWALTRLRPRERVHVQFDEIDAPILEEASRVLKERQERPDERIEGYVTSLARQRSDYEGNVRIKGVIDGSISSVRIDFAPEDYSQVVDAHDRRLVISLEGDLRREGQRWTLTNPRDLVIHEDD